MSAATIGGGGRVADALVRYAVVIALVVVSAGFAAATPHFLTQANLASILANNFALLAIAATAMTLVVASGGIDLSVGTAIDFASLAFVSLVLAGQPVPLAAVVGLLAGAGVGLFNGLLIAGLGITPFLATLGTLFIGRSVQQILTNGGNPVYLPPAGVPPLFTYFGQGTVLGVPFALAVVAVVLVVAGVVLGATRFGRTLIAIGAEPGVARYSGLPVGWTLVAVYVLGGLVAAVAGILLTAKVTVYVPNSGGAFLLNAIGAAFIGTTLSRDGRPNVLGTALGVLLLGIVANGLLLTGISFYWQQVGTGVVIFVVLAASFLNRRTRNVR